MNTVTFNPSRITGLEMDDREVHIRFKSGTEFVIPYTRNAVTLSPTGPRRLQSGCKFDVNDTVEFATDNGLRFDGVTLTGYVKCPNCKNFYKPGVTICECALAKQSKPNGG